MPREILLPKLSDTMEEGTILRWLKHPGDLVRRGEVLLEVETDKADMEVEAEAEGVLAEIRVQAGSSAAVGAVVAVMKEDDSTSTGASRSAVEPAANPAPSSPTPPAASRLAKKAPPASPSRADTPRVIMPPGARPPAPPLAAAPTPAPSPGNTAKEEAPEKAERGNRLRSAVAKQMVAAKRDIPHFYLSTEIDMSEAARLRKALSETPTFPERLTFTHLVLRALALTLPKHPRVNAWYDKDAVILHDDVHLGIAVAVDDGLLAPVLGNCRRRSLRNIARDTAALIEQAQSGRSKQLSGATFTLSNLGMLPVDAFCAVIIPPQAAILAIGAIRDRSVVRDGQLAIAKTMHATLSADHRVLTGYEGGRFLADLKTTLEQPAVLLLAEEDTSPG